MDYEIGKDTMAIINNKNGNTLICCLDNNIMVKDKPIKIIDNSCRYFGSSYQGRLQGTKKMINVSIKAPIIIEETKEIIFFPTSSPRNSNCNWISFNNIKKYDKKDEKTTIIEFINGYKIELPISYHIIENQVTRCMKLKLTLKDRKECIY